MSILRTLLRALFSRGDSGPTARRRIPRDLWSAEDWARVRAPVRHRDQELSPKARQWLQRLPEAVQPHELCAHYPRIANRLAACWSDLGLIDHLLDELLVDRRPDRQGFPVTVMQEILRLYEFHDLRLHGEEPEPPPPTQA